MIGFYAADTITDNKMIDIEEDILLPSVREWVDKRVTKLTYAAAEPFLYFLDKYTMVVVGGQRAMEKFYTDNQSKTFFDKIMASDIAYSVLVYESAYDVWKEEFHKSQMCKTAEEKNHFHKARF